jgi:DNA repair exonuclease SbcCD ATPase subunit
MKITKIEWRNFSSYGNRTQELNLGNDSSLFQVVGENGAGKTSISQVISFGLYGKVEGKKLKDIPNRINGNAWVRITLDHFGSSVIVERGLDPNLFRLFIDGKEFDQAGNRTLQDYLTDDILGIPYYVFNNTISLSINDFKSFIKMTPQDKRGIIDKIFGFHVLNQMREILKSETKKIKESLDTLTGKLISLEGSIKNSMDEMNNLINEIEEESLSLIEDLSSKISTFENLQNLHNQKLAEFRKGEQELNQKTRDTNSLLIESQSKLRDLERKLRLYDNNICPTCEGSLETDFHANMKSSMSSEKKSIEDKIEEIENSLGELRALESSSASTRNDLLEKGMKIKNKLDSIQKELKELKTKKSDKQSQSLQRIIDSLSSDQEKTTSQKFKEEEKHNWLKTIDEILGEKGVKQMAIRTILPSLNSEILELLRRMNLSYQVVFDEEFNALIYHMGIEIPSQTLSTGEMKKVDFVVLVAIMKLMKLKFSSINLLFLDELFSSVDPDGVYSILSILKSTCSDLGLNIFVINHAPMPHEIFDWKLEVTKKNNFSSLALEKI